MKKKLLIASTIATSMLYPVTAFASEASGTANSAVVSAMQTTANDMIATGQAILPIALSVLGLILVVRYGKNLFRQVSR